MRGSFPAASRIAAPVPHAAAAIRLAAHAEKAYSSPLIVAAVSAAQRHQPRGRAAGERRDLDRTLPPLRGMLGLVQLQLDPQQPRQILRKDAEQLGRTGRRHGACVLG